jgi:hypothetical protein
MTTPTEWGKCRKCGNALSEETWADGPFIEFLQSDWCVTCWAAEAKTVECVLCGEEVTGHDGIDFREGHNPAEDKPTGEYACEPCCERAERDQEYEQASRHEL